MKKEKILITLIICIICILMVPTISNAGLEIKSGTTAWKNINVSESYKVCRDLANKDSTLGNNSLDPHLVLNKDWGAVAYLAISSAYGAVTNDKGPTMLIGDISYYTTTGNPTGVINFGTNGYVQTAGVRIDDDGTGSVYRTNLINDKGTKYVEEISSDYNSEDNKGMALGETWGWLGSNTTFAYPEARGPISIRQGILGGGSSWTTNSNRFGAGIPYSAIGFRPAIWN